MPQQRAEKQYNTFIKGLITEVSPLTFPENFASDLSNLILERSGKVSRRLGVNYETGYNLVPSLWSDVQLSSSRIGFYSWPTPSGNPDINLGVVRISGRLWFLDTLTENPSNNIIAGPMGIPFLGNSEIDVAIIHNNFVIVSEDLYDPVVLTFTAPSTVTIQTIRPMIRDIWGIYESLRLNERPATLSDIHSYNLRNQGWTNAIYNSCNTAGIDSIQCTKNKMGVFPSNSDLWTYGKIADASSPDYQEYDPQTMFKNSFDVAPAGKGRMIISLFNRGGDRKNAAAHDGLSGSAVLPEDRETGRLTTVASFSGRLFYSGVTSQVVGGDRNSPNYAGMIFFSQVGYSIESLARCYQDADPTSPEISDIVDTDGGVIHIPDVSKVHKLLATRTSLLVFAQNGVWEIFGDTGGFTATSFQISKVSSVGVESQYSIVETNNNMVLYWAKGGIYGLTQDQISGRYAIQNLSIDTIQTLYNNINDVAKKYAKSYYEETQNRVRWLYNDTDDYQEGVYVNKYNKELIFDMTLGAFYINEIVMNDLSPYIAGYAPIPKWVRSDLMDSVYAGIEPVWVGSDEVVSKAVGVSDPRESEYKFLVMQGTSFTLAEYNSLFFKDWIASNGAGYNYSSFLVTGYEIYQDFMRRKQVPYLVVALERTEDGFITNGAGLDASHPSGCLVQAQWNFTNALSSNKWGTIFQAYRLTKHYIPMGVGDLFDIGERVIITKNKLRGTGRALSLKFQSEEGKDMRILGWATTLTMGQTV